MKDPYETLGISPDESIAGIKDAYRALAMKHHPDRKDGDHHLMQEIQAAYDILKDPEKRARYDRTGSLEDTPAEMRLRQLLRSAVDHGNWHLDIVQDMRMQLGDVMRGIVQANEGHWRDIGKLGDKIGRVTGGPLMDEILQSKINHLSAVIDANKLEHALVEEVLGMLMDYRDGKPVPLAWSETGGN